MRFTGHDAHFRPTTNLYGGTNFDSCGARGVFFTIKTFMCRLQNIGRKAEIPADYERRAFVAKWFAAACVLGGGGGNLTNLGSCNYFNRYFLEWFRFWLIHWRKFQLYHCAKYCKSSYGTVRLSILGSEYCDVHDGTLDVSVDVDTTVVVKITWARRARRSQPSKISSRQM